MADLVCVKCKNVKGASENLQPRKCGSTKHTMRGWRVNNTVCAIGWFRVSLTAAGCACSGEYRPRDSRQSFIELLQTFVHIAKYHKFEWLEESAAWLHQERSANEYCAVDWTR
jgi:hypothetical protein